MSSSSFVSAVRLLPASRMSHRSAYEQSRLSNTKLPLPVSQQQPRKGASPSSTQAVHPSGNAYSRYILKEFDAHQGHYETQRTLKASLQETKSCRQ